LTKANGQQNFFRGERERDRKRERDVERERKKERRVRENRKIDKRERKERLSPLSDILIIL